MTNQVAIHAVDLGKRYYIDPSKTHIDNPTVRDFLVRRMIDVLRGNHSSAEPFWALRDVNLEVPVGQVLGVIGKNGAGKSTLLKILSRVIRPSEGYAEVRGRVGSLLEVGIGFHPDLTGRENIFLNAAILGMPRALVNERFAEIVDFSEIGAFLDTPVKRYSSGMYIRLAFSVAIHMELDVLIVDEVLAVGDLGFQAKCLERIRLMVKDGRTVLLVSHSVSYIEELADRVLWLDKGRIKMFGDPATVIEGYQSYLAAKPRL